MLKGHDVSKWQGNTNPPDGDFLIAKSTQGVAEIDRSYAAHRAGALQAGKLFGSYHYGDGISHAATEATYYVNHTVRRPGELMALDFESGELLHNQSDPVLWALQFLNTVRSLCAVRPLLYVSRDVLHRFDWRRVAAADYGLWLADWTTIPPGSVRPWEFAALWQSGDGNGKLDADVFYGSRAAWQAYGGTAGHLYTVRAGDTLTSIAAKLGTTAGTLARVNHLANPNLIYPGQRLTFPG